MFVLTVNPISSWDLSIFYCPIGSSNSVWSNQTQSGVIKLLFLFLTLFCNPLLLTAIFLSLDPLFCLSSNLKSQSYVVFFLFYSCLQNSFLLSKISPNSLTQYPRPSITQLYFLCSISLLSPCSSQEPNGIACGFPNTPHTATPLSLPSARNAICFCLSKSSLFLRSGSKRHSPVFWSSLKFNEEFTVSYEHCVNKKGCKDSSNKDKCMK